MTSTDPVFEVMTTEGFETVAFGHDTATGLRSIVAIHSTVLGPSLGGTRFRPYPTEHDALVDVCRLAHGMSLKHAAAGLDHGGGKAVIIGDPRQIRTDELMLAYGRFIDGLAGRYLTAEDVGTTQADMDLIRTVTPYVTGTSEHLGGSGDPSPATAWGVLWAMRAAAEHRWGDGDLSGRHICISGVGKVGAALAELLAKEGSRLTISDVDQAALDRVTAVTGATVVAPDSAHRVECDLFSPCALGAVLNRTSIPELRCAVVVGSANNQLQGEADGQRIHDRGVLYVPDFVANAGGVINIAEETGGYDHDRAWQHITDIHDNVSRVLARADAEGITPADAAVRLAEERIEQHRKVGA